MTCILAIDVGFFLVGLCRGVLFERLPDPPTVKVRV